MKRQGGALVLALLLCGVCSLPGLRFDDALVPLGVTTGGKTAQRRLLERRGKQPPPAQPKPGEVSGETVVTAYCPKEDPVVTKTCLGFNPVCRPSGKDCNPATSSQLPIYITAYPVSVRNIVDKSMEVEVLLQYYLLWQDNSVDAAVDVDDIWKPKVFVENAVSVDWVIKDEVHWTITDRMQKEVTGLNVTNMKMSGRALFTVTNRGHWKMNHFPFDDRRIFINIANQYPTYSKLVPFFYSSFPRSMEGKLPGIWISTTPEGLRSTKEGTHPIFDLLALNDPEIDFSKDLVVKLEFSCQRDGWVYVETCMFPVVCCFTIMYFGFYVPISVRMPRFATAVIPFLATASLKRAIEAKIPSGATDCFLEKWLSFQMGMLMMGCVQHLLAFNIHEFRKLDMGKGLMKNGRSTHVPDVDLPWRICMPILFLLTFVQAWLCSSDDSVQKLLAWGMLLLWPLPFCAGKACIIRCGWERLLHGYDEKHGTEPKKKDDDFEFAEVSDEDERDIAIEEALSAFEANQLAADSMNSARATGVGIEMEASEVSRRKA